MSESPDQDEGSTSVGSLGRGCAIAFGIALLILLFIVGTCFL